MADIKVYTPAEVAELLKLSRQTIYNYIIDGKLHAVQFGREYRVTEEDLKAFIKTGNPGKIGKKK